MKIEVKSIVLLKKLKNEYGYYFGWNSNIKQYYRKVGVVKKLISSHEQLGALVSFKNSHPRDEFTFLIEDLIVLDYIKYLI
jgi:hypothetical protein